MAGVATDPPTLRVHPSERPRSSLGQGPRSSPSARTHRGPLLTLRPHTSVPTPPCPHLRLHGVTATTAASQPPGRKLAWPPHVAPARDAAFRRGRCPAPVARDVAGVDRAPGQCLRRHDRATARRISSPMDTRTPEPRPAARRRHCVLHIRDHMLPRHRRTTRSGARGHRRTNRAPPKLIADASSEQTHWPPVLTATSQHDGHRHSAPSDTMHRSGRKSERTSEPASTSR